ncbi:MAG: flavodoxin family protein [Victivallaceae bacterium]
MKVLGVSCSPRRNHSTDLLVRETLAGVTGAETEFVSLAGLTIGGCIACLGCVKDNVCKVKDDMQGLRQKIVEADAYVIGAPNYYSMINGLGHCFLERFYQFRHLGGDGVSGKLGIAIAVGSRSGNPVIENIKTFFKYNQIECVGDVSAQGAASCFSCGCGEDCKVGAIHMSFGAGTKITPEITPDLSKQPDKMEKARQLGYELSARLKKSNPVK